MHIDYLTARNAQLACVWEATARKPGNVHRYCDFRDANYVDFLASAAAVAPVLGAAAGRPVGETVRECVRRTREVAASNTNLGIILLLAPLASGEVNAVLDGLTVEDSRRVYEAIRLAAPAGLGRVEEGDVSEVPARPLRELMALAAKRDLVAAQYANGFDEVFECAGQLAALAGAMCTLECAIIATYLSLMMERPDTLIARKCGAAVAEEAARRAGEVMLSGWPETADGRERFRDFDGWLRGDGNRRNPGATADVIAAALFVALQRGAIELPLRVPWAMAEGV